MSSDSSPASSAAPGRRGPDPRLPVRATTILRARTVWTIPLVLASAVAAVMAVLYIGSVVNPLAHLRGLPVAVVAASAGLLFWLVAGTAIAKWYDHRRLYRLHPDVLAHVNTAVQDYRASQADAAPAPAQGPASAEPHAPAADTGQPPRGGEAEPGRPQAG